MATIQWQLEEPTFNGGDLLPTGVVVVKWPNMASGDAGAPFRLPPKAEATITAGGVYGAAQLKIEGNDAVTGTKRWSQLANQEATVLTFAAATSNPHSMLVNESPFELRPNIPAGDVNTLVTVRLTLKM